MLLLVVHPLLKNISRKVDKWVVQIKRLSEIALTQHVACSAFNHGLACQWSYISRTVENISSMMQPLEEAIRDFHSCHNWPATL